MTALVIALGFAVLFQFIILRIKWNKGNYADVGVDVAMLVLLNSIFGGAILGVISATAGSTLISLYLIRYPIKLFKTKPEFNIDEFFTSQQPGSLTERFDNLFKENNNGKI